MRPAERPTSRRAASPEARAGRCRSRRPARPPVHVGRALEHRRLVREGGRSERPDEVFEAGGCGHHQHARLARSRVLDGVRHAARRVREVARAQNAHLIAEPDRQLALDHVEALVEITMYVQRRGEALRTAHLGKRVGAAALLAGDQDVDQLIEEPVRLHTSSFVGRRWSHNERRRSRCRGPLSRWRAEEASSRDARRDLLSRGFHRCVSIRS